MNKPALIKLITLILLTLLSTLHAQLVTGHAQETTFQSGDTGAAIATRKPVAANKFHAIPWDQIGAKAAAEYHSDGQAVIAEGAGARLHCVFQRLEGEATPEGLWLTSTVTNPPSDRFQVKAVAVGRRAGVERGASERQRVLPTLYAPRSNALRLPDPGTVSVDGQTVRFTRPGLVEEYTVSMNGVRQDFVVTTKPTGVGELQVRMAVAGAQVEPTTYGARLVLDCSGRKIAYSRLRATDATGKELKARIEATDGLDLIVEDADAVYPVRIDPTFSDANWISQGGIAGTDGTVNAAVVDGAGNLYIGGDFAVAGNVVANHVAKWDGSSWSALGSGMSVRVHAGTPSVMALAVSGNTLYAGGYFTRAGGVAATNIAKWDGSSWSGLGSGITDNYVRTLAVSGTTLYAGGDFTTAGGLPANYIARWDGSSWSALGLGVSVPVGTGAPTVRALAVSGANLFVGGQFTTAGGVAATNIAQWNGSDWSALGSGLDSGVSALAVSGTNLFVGGSFTTAGGVVANSIAEWNGNSWSALGSGLNSYADVLALAVSGTNLFVGGQFTIVGGVAATNIAQWNGSSWSALGSGLNSVVFALAVSGNTLYPGGQFWEPSYGSADFVAQWDGRSWSAMGSGSWFDGPVFALAASGDTLYVGGYFSTAGGVAANNIAQWDGSNWSALRSGINSPGYPGNLAYPVVYALAASGNTLYAGGDFTTAAGVVANYIAQWDGSNWSALGLGLNSYPHALAVSGNTLYAGGTFTTAGGIPANNIAQWDGSTWSALGSGIDAEVSALAVSGNTLYVGGYFTTAGGAPANNIAKWNGSRWSALGSGIDIEVATLAVSGNTLFVGGGFTTAGGIPANNIAQWDGSRWSALGSGTLGQNAGVNVLAVSGNTLYAGGYFATAGGKASPYFAEAVLVWPQITSGPLPNPDGSMTLNLSTGPNSPSRLYSTTDLAAPVLWQPIYTNLTGGLWQFTDTDTTRFRTKFYRLFAP